MTIEEIEDLIIAALPADGSWVTQAQIRKATGQPISRVQNFTLALALEDRIGRKLSPDHRTQLFRREPVTLAEVRAYIGAHGRDAAAAEFGSGWIREVK